MTGKQVSNGMTAKIGIIGHGFVGSAVANGFKRDVNKLIVDPALTDVTIKVLVDNFNPEGVFVCVPTPETKSGDVCVDIATEVLKELHDLKYKGIVIIKSTITPRHLTRFKKKFSTLKLVYNPEFLTEANSLNDFLNPSMQILGGKWRDCEWVERLYVRHSNVRVVPTFKVDLITASMLKYTINSWLATKVTFFNELRELYDASNTKVPWESFTDMLTRDPRMGDTHMQVPGPDRQTGFGGHCFPKDTAALLYYAESLGVNLSVLDQAVTKNKSIRS